MQQPLHPEILSIVELNSAHGRKPYYSGRLIRRVERQADGQRPANDEGWTDVWAQLNGITLSTWDMRQIEEARKQGTEAPPTYINVTDAFVRVVGTINVPETYTSPAQKYHNVLTLNTAGCNLILFSCPSVLALTSLASALRLCIWEKSRLEEIYTAHMIKTFLGVPNPQTALVRGQLEGRVRVRVAGQTTWKERWMVVHGPSDDANDGTATPSKSKRVSTLLSHHESAKPSGVKKPTISIYESDKPKDMKKAAVSMTLVKQAFAVFPERPELISHSTLIKVEGRIGDEHTAGVMKGQEGWLLIMPETHSGCNPTAELLKWIVGLHHTFGLYGRPQAYTWDHNDHLSMLFAYPDRSIKNLLFLRPEDAINLDPKEDRTSIVRSNLLGILIQRYHNPPPEPEEQVFAADLDDPSFSEEDQRKVDDLPQLPAVSFTPSLELKEHPVLVPFTDVHSPIIDKAAISRSSLTSSLTLNEVEQEDGVDLDSPPLKSSPPPENDEPITPSSTTGCSEDSSKLADEPKSDPKPASLAVKMESLHMY